MKARRGHWYKGVALALLAGSVPFVWAGCSDKPTELVAGVTTQIQVPKYLKMVGLVVQLGGAVRFCEAYPVYDGTVSLPSTIGVVPDENAESVPTDPVTVSVLGFRVEQPQFETDCITNISDADDAEVMVVRRRRLPYVEDRILYIPLPLRESCEDVACPDDQTCFGGKCEDSTLGEDEIVDYNDSLVFGNTNTCFSVERCLDPSLSPPVTLVDKATCEFEVQLPDGAPEPVPGNLNVQVVYSSFGTEILDLDGREGFFFPDENNPLRFRLAPNLCETNYQTGKIIGVAASPACPAKRPLQPICDGDLADILSGDTFDALVNGPGRENLCTLGDALQQTESALYVLLDRSASMGDFYGPEGLSLAIDTPLANPIAARTKVALAPLPGDAQQCTGTNDYANPESASLGGVAFRGVEENRQPIADFIGNTANVLANDPEMYMDVALQPNGAYQALRSLTPDASSRFNRRAVLIVSNRDFQEHCGGEPLASLAADALDVMTPQDRIYTYAVALDAPAGAEQYGGDPATDSAALASGGGTTGYNAIDDELEGPKALQEIVNDLGSCLYDPPEGLPTDNASAKLSYLNPLTLKRVDVDFNGACTEDAFDDNSGWNLEPDGSVRICGQACQELRDVLTDVALAAAITESQAPPVPVHLAVPCDDGALTPSGGSGNQ